MSRSGCVIWTYSGKQVDLSKPDRRDIDIADIARSLGNQCRFNGHVSSYYSVAEHSVHVSCLVPEEDALWGLLHDAAEAYVGDVVRPVRRHPLLHGFSELEEAVLGAVASAFYLRLPIPETVIQADQAMLAAEKAVLLPRFPAGEPDSASCDLRRLIRCWEPETAARKFLARFDDLVLGPATGRLPYV